MSTHVDTLVCMAMIPGTDTFAPIYAAVNSKPPIAGRLRGGLHFLLRKNMTLQETRSLLTTGFSVFLIIIILKSAKGLN